MGDEIILIAENYATAYLIAIYIILNWKYKGNNPYFGVTHGVIKQSIDEIDLEIWNHKIVKEARMGNDFIKSSKPRVQLIYWNEPNHSKEKELVNLLLKLQGDLINEQTKKQQEITSLYMIFNSQKEIANHLNRGPSTISSHYTKGKTELIVETFNALLEMFSAKQADDLGTEKIEIDSEYKMIRERLNHLIKKEILPFM
jgi:hypothetical protein